MEGGQRWIAAGLAVLGLVLVGMFLSLGEEPRRLEDGGEVLWEVTALGITRVERPGAWALARQDGAWWLVDGPVREPADELAVREIIDALDEAHRGVMVPGDPSDFGFDDPVVITLDAGEGPLALEVGAEAPVGLRTYVRRPGGPVLAVRGGVGVALRIDRGALLGAAAPAGAR